MSPSEGTIVPALPLSNVPPSPRSDVSATTEPSQNSDQSVDRITTRMSQISLSPQSPIRVNLLCSIVVNVRLHGSPTRVNHSQRVDGGIENMLRGYAVP